MKNLVLLALLSLTGWCATAQATPGKDTTAVLLDIRKEYQMINNEAKHYKKVKIDVSDQGYSTEGGTLYQYYDQNKKLRKIEAIFYGESGDTREEYYLRNDSLLFLFKTDRSYDSLTTVDSHPKVTAIYENRYYFDQGHLVQWLHGKTQEPKNEWPQAEQEILSFVKDLAGKRAE